MTPRSHVVHFIDAQAQVPTPSGQHFIEAFHHGTLNAKLSMGRFAPRPNRQTPHLQDELYVIVQGTGVLFHGGCRDAFQAGDLLFVAAGVEHHFEEFSDDLAVWVLFYGPQGGEIPEGRKNSR